MDGEYSVCQFFPTGHGYEYVRRFVDAQEAVKAFEHYISSVGAHIGTTQRVIITDGGDSTCVEWIFGQGIVYPPELSGIARRIKL
jgi:hypothetical protein